MEKLRVAFKKNISPVVYCAITVKTGTRNENPIYNGLAHFTEHMLFKGTKNRKSLSINNCLENVGGELNAYTTKEETVLQATVLKDDLAKAIDLLFELVFESTFPSVELSKERDVILDEIISYKDSPAEAIYDEFESMFFKSHPLSLAILGEKKTLKKIDSKIMLEYLHKYFVISNLCFTIMGDSSSSQIEKLLKSTFKKHYRESFEIEFIEEDNNYDWANINSNLSIGNKFNTILHKRNHQSHCIIGSSAYSYYDNNRIAHSMLSNILGGPASNSKLNLLLREKYGLVYNIEANYSPYADTGLFSIYFACDKVYLDRCFNLVMKELRNARECIMSDVMLRRAKKQLLGQLSISVDNAESQVLSMGKSILVYQGIASFNNMKERIERISAKDLNNVAREILDKDRLSVLIYQ